MNLFSYILIYLIKQHQARTILPYLMALGRGFEPHLPDSQSGVQPLHLTQQTWCAATPKKPDPAYRRFKMLVDFLKLSQSRLTL